MATMAMGPQIYVVLEREFTQSIERVYKPGFSDNLDQLMSRYPSGSHLLASCRVDNGKAAKKALFAALDTTDGLTKRTDIGREYYEGDYVVLMDVFLRICSERKAEPEWTPKLADVRSSSSSLTRLAVGPYIFVVLEDEFVHGACRAYRLGFSDDLPIQGSCSAASQAAAEQLPRLSQFPRGNLLALCRVADSRAAGSALLAALDATDGLSECIDLGPEYYEGDYELLMNVFLRICSAHKA